MSLKDLGDKKEQGTLAILLIILNGFILYIFEITGKINWVNNSFVRYIWGIPVFTVALVLSIRGLMTPGCNRRQSRAAFGAAGSLIFVLIEIIIDTIERLK